MNTPHDVMGRFFRLEGRMRIGTEEIALFSQKMGEFGG